MSQFSKWYASFKLGSLERAAKALLKILKPILAPALKASVGTIWLSAQDAVDKAEQTGGSGDDKFQIAFKEIVSGLGEASKVFFSVAIEIGVAFLRAKYKL